MVCRLGPVKVHSDTQEGDVNADALSISDHLDEPSKEENEEYQADNEVAELKITYATNLG